MGIISFNDTGDDINAKNEIDAKEKLLSISSQFGEINLEELDVWLEDMEQTTKETLRLADNEIVLVPERIKKRGTLLGLCLLKSALNFVPLLPHFGYLRQITLLNIEPINIPRELGNLRSFSAH